MAEIKKYEPDQASKAGLYDVLAGKIARDIRNLETTFLPSHEEAAEKVIREILSIAQNDQKTASGRLIEIHRLYEGVTSKAQMAISTVQADHIKLQLLRETWS